jgi:hypothetical protein
VLIFKSSASYFQKRFHQKAVITFFTTRWPNSLPITNIYRIPLKWVLQWCLRKLSGYLIGICTCVLRWISLLQWYRGKKEEGTWMRSNVEELWRATAWESQLVRELYKKSRSAIYRIIEKYHADKVLGRKPGGGRKRKTSVTHPKSIYGQICVEILYRLHIEYGSVAITVKKLSVKNRSKTPVASFLSDTVH